MEEKLGKIKKKQNIITAIIQTCPLIGNALFVIVAIIISIGLGKITTTIFQSFFQEWNIEIAKHSLITQYLYLAVVGIGSAIIIAFILACVSLIINKIITFKHKIEAIKRYTYLPLTEEDLETLGLNTFSKFVSFVYDLITYSIFYFGKGGFAQIEIPKSVRTKLFELCLTYYTNENHEIIRHFFRDVETNMDFDEITPWWETYTPWKNYAL